VKNICFRKNPSKNEHSTTQEKNPRRN